MLIVALSVMCIACVMYVCVSRDRTCTVHVDVRRAQYVTSDAYIRKEWRNYDPSIGR